MKHALAFAISLLATNVVAAPIKNERDAIKAGCAVVHTHLPSEDNNCDDFVARLRGDVWTVSEKPSSDGLEGGGAPAVELSQEDGHVLAFDLTD
jgi:hypothetical protein